jgi:hypothetical protein
VVMTKVSEIVTSLLQSQIDAQRTAVKSLITPVFNVVGYGALLDGTTDDTTAVQSASDAAAVAGGGMIFFPEGTCLLTGSGVTATDSIIFRGVGRGSVIKYTGTGQAITMGSETSALKYGLGVFDVNVLLTASNAGGIHLKGTAAAHLQNIYIEGPVPAVGTKGVTIDGSGAANIFTTMVNVTCNHIDQSFRLLGATGSTSTTSVTAVGCNAFGDVVHGNTTSIGIYVQRFNGQGSRFFGGNLEECAKGILLESVVGEGGASKVSFFGTRFEGNTVDVEFGTFSGRNMFIACHDLDTIVNNAGTDHNNNTFIACVKTDGTPQPFNRQFGGTAGNLFFNWGATDPVVVAQLLDPGDTGDLFQGKRSDGSLMYAVDSSGYIDRIGQRDVGVYSSNGSPEGVVTAPAGSICLNVAGGTGTSLYAKESGAGDTGWIAK